MTADQAKCSRRLYDLADAALTEREQWKNPVIRYELDGIRRDLETAARHALTIDEDISDAWAEAAVILLNRYTALRKLRENVWPPNHPNGSGA